MTTLRKGEKGKTENWRKGNNLFSEIFSERSNCLRCNVVYSNKYVSINKVKADLNRISFLFNIDNWHKMQNGAKKEKKRKENVGRSFIERKWTQTQIHLSCVNVTNMPRFPSSSTYEMKNCWLVSLGRKEDIGRKTCSHGNTALGFIHRVFAEVPPIFGTILEIISVSLSLFLRFTGTMRVA